VVKAKLSDKQRDYASIVSVVDRFDRPIGAAELGKHRRRWLDYPPRDPSSGHRNRLEEVLAKMVKDEVLRATKTSRDALLYSRGPNFGEYQLYFARRRMRYFLGSCFMIQCPLQDDFPS